MADAGVEQLSRDRRSATAYGAALELATIVIAAAGFRVAAQRGHHAVAWQVLPEVTGADVTTAAVSFDACRALRNRSDYDKVGAVSRADVDEILRETAAFREVVLGWLQRHHPEFRP